MLLNEYAIMSDTGNTELLRLYNSYAVRGKRQLANHHHSMIEISLIKRGSGAYTVGDQIYDIKAGDVFMFSGDEPHCITQIDTKDMLILNLHFEPRFIWSPGNSMFDAKYLRVFLNRAADFSNRLERESDPTPEIGSLLMSMEHEFEAAEPEYELMVKIKLLTILVLMSRSRGSTECDMQMSDDPNLTAMDQVMDYINQNLTSQLSLDELAKRASMSRSYFSTTFKRLNGMTPWEYIMLKRVEIAIQLLNKDGKSVIEVAGECGFNSTANFNRAFKKITGRTPTSYRHSDE